jgi:hypothetical protein
VASHHITNASSLPWRSELSNSVSASA